MNTKWNNNEVGNKSAADVFGDIFKDQYTVILLRGKNSFGDKIFSYIQVSLPNIKNLHAALTAGNDFSPSDFGTVIAAGQGEPSEELRAEMASNYKMFDEPMAPIVYEEGKPPRQLPQDKKAWDEY